MPVFIDGQDIDYQFAAEPDPIGVLDTVQTDGRTLELRDVAVFAGDGSYREVGVSQLAAMIRYVVELARLEGYERVVVTGKRLTGARPGRTVHLERTIR